jgi:hypothetical protein
MQVRDRSQREIPYLARKLLVLGLVSTLTSKIDVINLLMVGAKQHGDMGLSWFRPRGRTSSRLRVCVVLRCTGGGCRGGLQASKSLLDD